MCSICICKLKIKFDFYIGENAEATYLMVSDLIPMKKVRLHIYRILAKGLLKKNIKNNTQETSKSNNIKIIKPITHENTPIKQTKTY